MGSIRDHLPREHRENENKIVADIVNTPELQEALERAGLKLADRVNSNRYDTAGDRAEDMVVLAAVTFLVNFIYAERMERAAREASNEE